MQGHRSWFSIRIHILCHYSMPRAMGSCKMERYILRLHQNISTLSSRAGLVAQLLMNRTGRKLCIQNYLIKGLNHRCCEIWTLETDTDKSLESDLTEMWDLLTRTVKRQQPNMSDDRVRRIASEDSRWIESTVLSISISEWMMMRCGYQKNLTYKLRKFQS